MKEIMNEVSRSSHTLPSLDLCVKGIVCSRTWDYVLYLETSVGISCRAARIELYAVRLEGDNIHTMCRGHPVLHLMPSGKAMLVTSISGLPWSSSFVGLICHW